MLKCLDALIGRGLLSLAVVSAASLGILGPTPRASAGDDGKKVVQLPIRSDGPKSLDPVFGSTVYDNIACSQVYEPLLDFKYLVRPEVVKSPQQVLDPLLLAEMPRVSTDGLTYHFTLKPGVHFADDPCFPGGKGRELKSSDVFYSWKRMADDGNQPKSWWLFENQIVGFDDYRKAQNARVSAKAGAFDYDAPVTGLKVINDREFEVTLTRPIQQFIYKLTMFQFAIVAREAVVKYGKDFAKHPVGTGPFVLDLWEPGKSLSFNRNPNYHHCVYPSECDDDLKAAGYAKAAGTPLPIADRLEFTMYVQDEPMWLNFEAGKLGYVEVPSEYFDKAFNKRTKKLKAAYADRGITDHRKLLLDEIFDGFNMEDPVIGGYTPEKKALRQAISLALDFEEINQSFYNGIVLVFDGVIPPGLDGYPKDGKAPKNYRGPNIDRAKELMAKAGYPDGKGKDGKPLRIQYFTQRGANSPEQTEMRKRQLAAIGVQLEDRLIDFSELIEKVSHKECQMFSFAWASDYPDAEDNLALLYGPYEAPGSNSFNYKQSDYDQMYLQCQIIPPGPERTALYEKMRDRAIEDVPFCGSMARTRFYLVNPWLKNLKPTEDFWTWYKYLDVDDSKRP
jgi:ABC-type transport system substrate-binding protein